MEKWDGNDIKLNDVINVVSQTLDRMQEEMYQKALDNLHEKTYTAKNLDEVKKIMDEHPGVIYAHWCGSEECELKMKEIKGTKSRCIVETEDYEKEKCVVCGKKAKHNVVWGIQY